MARRRHRRHIPWLTLIALAVVERWIRREQAHSPVTVRRRNSLARMLVLERLGYYSPWLVGARLLSGFFRRGGGDSAIV